MDERKQNKKKKNRGSRGKRGESNLVEYNVYSLKGREEGKRERKGYISNNSKPSGALFCLEFSTPHYIDYVEPRAEPGEISLWGRGWKERENGRRVGCINKIRNKKKLADFCMGKCRP